MTTREEGKAKRRWKGVDPTTSRIMSLVRGKDTGPEMAVRRLVHGLGYRYALHRKDLPGTPDLVFAPRRKVIFVHGCFWHGHHCRTGDRLPKKRAEYWSAKIARNKHRDASVRRRLRVMGWSILTIWECQLRNPASLTQRLQRFLYNDKNKRR